MKPEDKQLLLADLCARLPYGLKGKCEIDASYDTSFDTIFQLHKFDAVLEGIKGGLLFVTPLIEDKDEQEFANEEVADGIDILDFKPYLRPMSSMTEEEKKEYNIFFEEYAPDDRWPYLTKNFVEEELVSELIDWLNKKMFDFRGLIPKDLALSTDEFNPYIDNLT